MESLPKILNAASFAAKKHRDQKRKGGDSEPYINHPIEVANLLTNVGKVDDTDMIVAALLHDTVEDTDATFEEIEAMFGKVVTDYVRELTDDKSLPQAERKRLQIDHAPHLSTGAKQIKLADLRKKEKVISKADKNLVNLITASINDIADENGWTFLGELGNLLLKKRPDFDPRNYGFEKLLQLIKSLGLYEIDQRESGRKNVKLVYVRVK